jgi:hypothetical protein
MHRSVPHDPEDAIPVGSQRGFIAFCETNLRYEKGFKAWIVLGPYLLGAFVLERIANTSGDTFALKLALWSGFLAYLIIFPDAWRRLLRWRNSHKTLPKSSSAPEEE